MPKAGNKISLKSYGVARGGGLLLLWWTSYSVVNLSSTEEGTVPVGQAPLFEAHCCNFLAWP